MSCIKKIFNFIKIRKFKFFAGLFSILIIITSFIFDCVFFERLSELGNQTGHVIIVLLPIVVSTLTISLSLPREKIYGIEYSDFRRLMGKDVYQFLEMFVYVIFIVSLYSLGIILNLKITIWVLEFVTLVYSFVFLKQEIPVLSKNYTTLRKIIKKSIFNLDALNISIDVVPLKLKMDSVLQNLLLSEGILSAYSMLETKDKIRNREMLERVLSLQNKFLFECIDNFSLNRESTSVEYKNINILNAVNMAINNISELVVFAPPINIVEFYDANAPFYNITRSLFALHKIISDFGLEEKYKKEYSKIVINIFSLIKYEKENLKKRFFLFRILNSMLIYTLSNNELWFIRILRDSAFPSPFSFYASTEYMIFVTAYVYFLVTLESRTPNELKLNLKEFLTEKIIDTDYESWGSVLKHKIQFLEKKEIVGLLKEILLIFNVSKEDTFSWYEPSFNSFRLTSFKNDFSKRLLINVWLGLVLTSESIEMESHNTKTVLDFSEIGEEDREIIAVELNKNWFCEDKLDNIKTIKFNEFIGIKFKIDNYMIDSDIVNQLLSFKKNVLKKSIKKELSQHISTPESLTQYKKILRTGFEKAVETFSFIDKEIDLTEEPAISINILFDSRWSDQLVKSYADSIPNILLNLIRENVGVLLDSQKKEISYFDSETLTEMISFKATRKSGHIPYEYSNLNNNALIKELNKLPTIKELGGLRYLLLRDNSISINFEYLEESYVKHLTAEEVDIIIDRDYKIVNGLYKYVEGADGEKSILVNREELTQLIKDKYFYAKIKFKYKIVLNKEDIIYIKKIN